MKLNLFGIKDSKKTEQVNGIDTGSQQGLFSAPVDNDMTMNGSIFNKVKKTETAENNPKISGAKNLLNALPGAKSKAEKFTAQSKSGSAQALAMTKESKTTTDKIDKESKNTIKLLTRNSAKMNKLNNKNQRLNAEIASLSAELARINAEQEQSSSVGTQRNPFGSFGNDDKNATTSLLTPTNPGTPTNSGSSERANNISSQIEALGGQTKSNNNSIKGLTRTNKTTFNKFRSNFNTANKKNIASQKAAAQGMSGAQTAQLVGAATAATGGLATATGSLLTLSANPATVSVGTILMGGGGIVTAGGGATSAAGSFAQSDYIGAANQLSAGTNSMAGSMNMATQANKDKQAQAPKENVTQNTTPKNPKISSIRTPA